MTFWSEEQTALRDTARRGGGHMHRTEVERHYRDARVLGIGGGATEVLNDLNSRLLGCAP